MDLHSVESYLRPTDLEEVKNWQPGWTWVAGGTWVFSELQPQINTLVDMQGLEWSELEVTPFGLFEQSLPMKIAITIGATCVMNRLLQFSYPENWTAVKALQSAVHELASFKVQNVATVAGNLCLALPASTFAPVMVALGASYEILPLEGMPYWVGALDFQTGAKQTILKPGEVLRKISIPQAFLEWRVNYQRICVATAGLAVSIVVALYNTQTSQLRFGIGACVSAPRLIEFAHVPSTTELAEALDAKIHLRDFLNDASASAVYRRYVTKVLMERSLQQAINHS